MHSAPAAVPQVTSCSRWPVCRAAARPSRQTSSQVSATQHPAARTADGQRPIGCRKAASATAHGFRAPASRFLGTAASSGHNTCDAGSDGQQDFNESPTRGAGTRQQQLQPQDGNAWRWPLLAAFTAAAVLTTALVATPAALAGGAAAVAAAETGNQLATAGAQAAAGGTTSQLIAVLLGWAVLIGSCFRSVPQIVKMVKANSSEGLSMTSMITESLCYTVTIAYNLQHAYPFNTYGDVAACWFQDLIIFALMVRHMKLKPELLAAGTVGFIAFSGWLFSGGVPMHVLEGLQCCNLAFSLIGVKAPQIWLNIKRGDTGMLSRTTGVLNVLGNLARVFTTAVLTQDLLIGAGYFIMLVLNGVLLLQTLASAKARKERGASGLDFGSGPAAVPA